MTETGAIIAQPSRSRPAVAGPLSWLPGGGKFRLLAGILLTLFAVYGFAYLAISVTRGWPRGFGDLFALWSWGRFIGEHPAVEIYDPALLRSAQLALGMDSHSSYPFAYPPSYLPVLWALGQLSGPVAFVLLMAASLPLYLWATLGRKWRPAALLAALVAPTTVIGIVSGQSGLVAAALFAGGLRLAADRPATAGVALGLLSYKPQLGLLIPVALVASRRWRTLGAAAATAIFMIIATSALFGPAIWPRWAAAIPAFSRQVGAEGGHPASDADDLRCALAARGRASNRASGAIDCDGSRGGAGLDDLSPWLEPAGRCGAAGRGAAGDTLCVCLRHAGPRDRDNLDRHRTTEGGRCIRDG